MKKTGIVIGKILLGILTFLLCVALFVSTVVTITMADIQVITNKDNLNTLISTYLTGSAPKKGAVGLPVAGRHAPQRLESIDVNAMASGDTSFLVEFVYDMIEEQAGGNLDVTLEEVKAFVEESTIDDFVAEKGTSLVSDFITGENTTSITTEEIKQVLQENAALLEQTFHVPMDETVISETITVIEETKVLEQLNEGGLEKLMELSDEGQLAPEGSVPDAEESVGTTTTNKEMTTDEIINGLLNGTVDISTLSVPQLLSVFRTAISAKTMWMCIGVCVVLIGLIFLTRWKKYYTAMIVTGVTLLITGAICMIPAIMFWSYPDAVANLVPELRTLMKLMTMIVDMTYPISLCVGIFGLLLIAGGIVLAVFSKKWAAAKAAKLAAAAEAEVVEEIPAEETVEEVPAVEAPAEEAPVEEVPAEEVPAEETPVEETPAEETPAEV